MSASCFHSARLAAIADSSMAATIGGCVADGIEEPHEQGGVRPEEGERAERGALDMHDAGGGEDGDVVADLGEAGREVQAHRAGSDKEFYGYLSVISAMRAAASAS